MNKEQREKRNKEIKIVALGIFLGLILGSLFMANEVHSERMKYEASIELLIFTINVSSYCAEINNMTYQEILDSYVINMAYELVGENNG